MTVDCHMTIVDRIRYTKERMIDSKRRYIKYVASGGLSSYGSGYEMGVFDSLENELQYLEDLYNGECSDD